MEAIAHLVRGRTVIMITHRLSTLGNVDDVVVLKGGRIIEAGPLRTLQRGSGEFARLLAEQSRYGAQRLVADDHRPDLQATPIAEGHGLSVAAPAGVLVARSSNNGGPPHSALD